MNCGLKANKDFKTAGRLLAQAGQPLTDKQIANWGARQELLAIKSNHPKIWRRLRYGSAVQASRSKVLFYGVGPRAYCEAERQRWAEGALASVMGPDGRSWAAVFRGKLSPGLRKSLRKPKASTLRTLAEQWEAVK